MDHAPGALPVRFVSIRLPRGRPANGRVRVPDRLLLAAVDAAPVPQTTLVIERLEHPAVPARALGDQAVLAPRARPEGEQQETEDHSDDVRNHWLPLPAENGAQTPATAAGYGNRWTVRLIIVMSRMRRIEGEPHTSSKRPPRSAMRCADARITPSAVESRNVTDAASTRSTEQPSASAASSASRSASAELISSSPSTLTTVAVSSTVSRVKRADAALGAPLLLASSIAKHLTPLVASGTTAPRHPSVAGRHDRITPVRHV